MKKILFLMSINFLWSCKNSINDKQSVNVTAIVDVTDRMTLLPNAEAILKLYDFNTDKDIEANFKICSLTDKQLNPDKNFHLPDNSVSEKR